MAGSPAHAGIDLDQRGPRRVMPWFPRTRGDRPFHIFGGSKKGSVPPHTRG